MVTESTGDEGPFERVFLYFFIRSPLFYMPEVYSLNFNFSDEVAPMYFLDGVGKC